MNSVKIDRFLGINTRLPEFSLTVRDVGRYVRDAVNVLFNKDGSVETRKPIYQVSQFDNAHSLFENYYVRGGILWKFDHPGATYSETMVKVLASDEPMSYARINGTLFLSNGVDRLRTNSEGRFVEWGLAAPAAPAVVSTSGALAVGEYQVALAYANAEEEGCLSPATIVRNDGTLPGGLLVSIPAGIPGATHVNVYVSGCGGNVPMFAASVPVGETVFEVSVKPAGREASRQIEGVLPAGSRIFEYNGRLCSVKGDTLYIGQPYRHGYFLPAEGYIPFKSDIQIAVGNQAGIYVATEEKTQFFVGADPTKVDNIIDVLPYGGLPRTEFEHPTDPNVGWFSAKGYVIADNTGQIKELMTERIANPATYGQASKVISAGWDSKAYYVLGCGWIVNLDTGAASRFDDAAMDFNSFSGEYGMSGIGIYSFAGEMSPVDAYVDLGVEDFDSEHEKYMPAAYVGASSTAPLDLIVTKMSGVSYSYPSRSYSETLGVHRFDSGKGLRDNWFKLRIANSDGGQFKLASLSFAPVKTTRKI